MNIYWMIPMWMILSGWEAERILKRHTTCLTTTDKPTRELLFKYIYIEYNDLSGTIFL